VSITIERSTADGPVRIAVAGHLTTHEAAEIVGLVARAGRRGADVDLTRSPSSDLGAVRVLATLLRRRAEDGGDVVVHGSRGAVQALLDIVASVRPVPCAREVRAA